MAGSGEQRQRVFLCRRTMKVEVIPMSFLKIIGRGRSLREELGR